MFAIKAEFDGEKVVLPEEFGGVPPGEVILIFNGGQDPSADAHAWMSAQEAAFAKVWDNDEDGVYDSM